MLIRIVPSLSLVLAVLGVPALALAQGTTDSTPTVQAPPAAASGDVDLVLKPRRHISLPRPPMETIVRDAEEAREAVLAEPRREEIAREARELPVLRPDLDPAVTGGIQTREIHRVLPR